MSNKKVIALAVLAALAATSQAQAQGWFNKESKGSTDGLGAVATEVATCKAHKEAKSRPGVKLPGLPFSIPKLNVGSKLPPLCVIETPSGILVITAEMLDEATINASLALDKAQNVLLPESKRIRLGIAQMLETRDGLDPKAAVSEQRTETAAAIGTTANEVAAALETMRANGVPLTPELRETLIDVSGLLNKATYYQAQTGVGVGLLQDSNGREVFKDATLEFFTKLPGRAKDLFANFDKLSTVQGAINAVSDKSMVSDLEKAKKKAAEEGEENARKLAASSDAAAREVNF